MSGRIVVAYIPVVHRGYLEFLQETGAQKVYLLAASDVPELPYLEREIRALRFDEISKLLRVFGFDTYRFEDSIKVIRESEFELCMPDEDITRTVCAKYFSDKNVTFLRSFLRWDWAQSVGFSPVLPEADRVIKKGEPEEEKVMRYMQKLFQERTKSSDWWRQVAGMALTRQGQYLVAYNQHFPNEYVPYMDGDPRNNFGPGEHIEVSTALHAERGIITKAASEGIALKGADLYVTTFPCGGCANDIAAVGFQRVFFTGGYSNLNGVKTLRDHGVELIYIET